MFAAKFSASQIGSAPIAGLLAASLLLAAAPANADWVTVTHPVRAGTVLERDHLSVSGGPRPPGAMERMEDVIGLESRVSLYPGRPLLAGEIGPPTLIRRNDVVVLVFSHGPLELQTEGRALDDGGMGDRIQVMNLDSRRTVWGSVAGRRRVEMR